MPAARIATDGTAPAQWGKVQANRARLTDRVIALLEEAKRDGTPLRWQRPWQGTPGSLTPVNAITGAPYRGGNALHLILSRARTRLRTRAVVHRAPSAATLVLFVRPFPVDASDA